MSSINIRKFYSTRRKRDVVTGAAIALFGALIVFQLYITIIFPIQLRHQKFLALDMERDEMYEQIDRIRQAVRGTNEKDYAHRGEVKLVEDVMDGFALHVREHSKEMTLEQVTSLRNVLSRYALIVCAWNPPRNSWILFPEETRARIEKTLGEYFGDMDSGGEIDFEKVVSFNQYLGSYTTKKSFHVQQESIDPAAYARALEDRIINGRTAPAQDLPQNQN